MLVFAVAGVILLLTLKDASTFSLRLDPNAPAYLDSLKPKIDRLEHKLSFAKLDLALHTFYETLSGSSFV